MDVAATNSDVLAKISQYCQENQFVSRLTVEELVGFGRYPLQQRAFNAR